MDYVKVFIKKYIALLIPAGIVLVALLLLLPTVITGKTLRKDMEKSIGLLKNVQARIKDAPSSDQAVIEEAYQNAYAKDAENVETKAKQCTMRDLISYRIFPKPKDTSVQVFTDFGKKFKEEIALLVRKMNARGAPTESEIKYELTKSGHADEKSGNYSSPVRRYQGRNPVKPTVDVRSAIEDAFLEQRAKEISVYASENTFGLYNFWTDYEYLGDQAIEDCWYSQIAFWLYQDVVDTIVAINTGADNVLTSPVKRLVGIGFNDIPDYSDDRSNTRSSNPMDFPQYVIGEVPSVLGTEPWTTRICNEDIDVVHFSVSVVIRAKDVFSFMEEICKAKEHTFHGFNGEASEEKYVHNQITILQYSQEPVVRDETVHEKYRYGNAAVVKLNLVCEYIFYRAGYDVIKPEKIVELLTTKETGYSGR